MKNINPINAQSNCLQGQKLPANWRQQATANAKQAEVDYQRRIENAWKPSSVPSNLPPIQAARLRNDAADHTPNSQQHTPIGAQKPQVRTDGELKLLFEDANGWQCWADQHGTKVWKRLDWEDLIGKK